jgi:hypothetical protein
MTEIKRYHCGNVYEFPHGDYITFADHQQALADRDRQIEKLRGDTCTQLDTITRLRADHDADAKRIAELEETNRNSVANYQMQVEELEAKLKRWTIDIMERREYAACWYACESGDCGNWPTCDPHCSLKEMMDQVGIVPQEDGGLDKQLAALDLDTQAEKKEGGE